MLIASLDESGRFESQNPDLCLVAGVIFVRDHDQIIADADAHKNGGKTIDVQEKITIENEQKRIVEFLADKCQRCHIRFPEDLHREWNANGQVENSWESTQILEVLKETLPTFFRKAEEYDLGRYYLYAVVSNRNDVSLFSGEDKGNLLSDAYAGNRYLHITQQAIRNIVLNNPFLQEHRYHFELATRVLALPHTGNSTLKDQAARLGLSKVIGSDGTLLPNAYRLTDTNSYLGALSGIVMEDERKNLDFNLNVQSIKYELHQERNLTQSFLWLADIICSLFAYLLKSTSDPIDQIRSLAKKLTGHDDNMIWCYDDVDFTLGKARKERKSGQWFDCLCSLYQIHTTDSDAGRYYATHWLPKELQQMEESLLPHLLEEAAHRLLHELSQPSLSAEIYRYIADILGSFADKAEGKEYAHSQYLLHRCRMILANQFGDYETAQTHYQNCQTLAPGVPLEEYIELCNHYSVTLLDRQEWKLALENAEYALTLAEESDKIRRHIGVPEGTISLCYGRTLSQLGQCRAFMGEYAKAEEAFLKAMIAFTNSPLDLQKTRSYLLHCYICSKNQKEFNKLATEYFGTADFAQQLQNCLDRDTIADAYALLVFLKAWYVFSAPKSFYPRMAEQYLKQALSKFQGRHSHPWELIGKYIVLLAKKNKLKKMDVNSVITSHVEQMAEESSGLLQRICLEVLDCCRTEADTSSLAYMYH